MWHWDQGHLSYFQFDSLRQIATFVEEHDFKTAERGHLKRETGLEFKAPKTHSPWRNYSRTLKLALLVSEIGGRAKATPVARLLAQPGAVTCDEYFHFLLCAFTEPSPALRDWDRNSHFRYPLLFALKYLLTKSSITENPVASLDEIIGAYKRTSLVGGEDESKFISAVRSSPANERAGKSLGQDIRQARESLKVISQISYLHVRRDRIFVTLDRLDAQEIFKDLTPIGGSKARNGEAEIRRLADLFKGGSTHLSFDYSHTVVDEIVESGFVGGNKIKKTHVTIERNATLRKHFFASRPTAICDVCHLDTSKTYPWTTRVMDLHHLLPLSSGTRVEGRSTTFDDLVPLCPSCHRAVHRFYDKWLEDNRRKDFSNREESYAAYEALKSKFDGLIIDS